MTSSARCRACGHDTNSALLGPLCRSCWDELDGDQLRDLASPEATDDPVLWRRAASHRAITSELARALVWVDDLDALLCLAANPATPVDVVSGLVEHPRSAVAAAARTASATRRAEPPQEVLPVPFVAEPTVPTPRRRVLRLAVAAGCFAALVVLFVALRGPEQQAASPPTTTRPAATTTAPVIIREVVERWSGTTASNARPVSIWGCEPGRATVVLEDVDRPVVLWVDGLAAGEATTGTSRVIEHPGGSVDVEVVATRPTRYTAVVRCAGRRDR